MLIHLLHLSWSTCLLPVLNISRLLVSSNQAMHHRPVDVKLVGNLLDRLSRVLRRPSNPPPLSFCQSTSLHFSKIRNNKDFNSIRPAVFINRSVRWELAFVRAGEIVRKLRRYHPRPELPFIYRARATSMDTGETAHCYSTRMDRPRAQSSTDQRGTWWPQLPAIIGQQILEPGCCYRLLQRRAETSQTPEKAGLLHPKHSSHRCHANTPDQNGTGQLD